MSAAPHVSPPTRAPTAALTAVLLLIAGIVAAIQLLLPWTYLAPSVGLPVEGGLTGWNVFRSTQVAASSSGSAAVAAYGVLGTAVAGLVLVLLAIAVLTGAHRRPVGLAALLVSLLMAGAAGWWLTSVHALLGRGLGQAFAEAGPGWYLFLVAGPIGVLGSLMVLRARG